MSRMHVTNAFRVRFPILIVTAQPREYHVEEMETQDSIDIAKLQRVALGLEHEPSQSFFSGPAGIARGSPQELNHFSHSPAGRSHGGISQTAVGLSSTSSSAATSTIKRPPTPSISWQYETNPVNAIHTATDRSKANPVSSAPSGKMDSAEPAPGDTQVVSQSVYDSIIRQNGESMYRGLSQNGADGATLRTLHEGDSGHIDLLSEFDTGRHEPHLSPGHDEESNYDGNESSPLAFQPEFFPESQRFMAMTPGTAVKMNQDTPSTSVRTPSTSRNPLAGDIESSGGLLALSQLFKATQAPSSPLVNNLQSELLSDRPSPNLPIQHPRLANAISSPLTERPLNFLRESSEPNLNYISLKESQSRRDKSLGERLIRSADNMQASDELDQVFYKESSFVENARRQRQIDGETAAQFAALNAPSRSATGVDTSPSRHNNESLPEEPALEVAGSEEETEQEDDLGPQVPQSQEILQSSEEDKENYIGPPLPVDATGSAHDRLSQVLAVDEHQSMAEQSIGLSGQGRAASPGHSQYLGRSSQVMVKDSQQTPQQSPRLNDQISKVPSPSYISVFDETSDVERPSPVRQRLQSSPPGARLKEGSWPESSTNIQTHPCLVIQATSSNETRQIQSSNASDQQTSGPIPKGTETGLENKSSSMPSRVTETPVHMRPQISDMARMTSIPETSPNRNRSNEWEGGSNRDGLNNEDDDLPPMFTAERIRNPRPRPSQTRALSSPIKTIQTQVQSQILSSPSGRQRRALTAIAADASPQTDHKFGDFGLDFFMAEDDQFSALVGDGSPTRPRKKRRGNLSQSLQTSEIALPATPRAQPPKTVAPTQPHWSAEKAMSQSQEISAVQVPTTVIRKQVKPSARPSSRRNENVWEIESPQRVVRRRSRSRPGRIMTSHDPAPQRVPVKFPEERPPVRPVVVHNPHSALSSELTDVDLPFEISMLSKINAIESASSPPQLSHIGACRDDAQTVAPNQVLAIWMGQKRAYYPATCFGTPLGGSQSKYSVKFDDSVPVEVVRGAVKRLELRVGDEVKVDMPHIPKIAHVIRGFDDKLTREEIVRAAGNGLYPQTDVYGHTTVIVAPKQRKSLPNSSLDTSENVTKVPISRIYMDTILWNRFKDRAYTYKPETAAPANTSRAPSVRPSLPASPNTRVARSIHDLTGIFANMAFAVSYKDDEDSKNRVTRLIRENGGSLLHDGFTELFETASINLVETPKKGGASDGNSSVNGLSLTGLAEDIGFTCLIADTHSRREKYMQALALNVPCLSGRWVEDCVAKGRVLDWDIYLLPAGESKYLNGATRSRIMSHISPMDARLFDTIATRPKLLDGKSVLIVMGRGKAEEKRKAYVFLTFALGASRVERVPDLETAKALLDSQSEASLPSSWDFIYVDDADQAAAKSMLAPCPPTTQTIHLVHGRKRRRSTVTMSRPSLASLLSPQVVGNEFVCQSLILGRLFEE
ncbi:uncharacterized protein N7482_002656 [Penicillium canariense]|uniref:BRCT domain-containing protein n=1 Tax=Penicillium canariense TaxID=189055 RepID=A0A9W9LV19_9EURO|nr:uncharacterized protein N7482_002656 [Penicillium canariense]KAJ5176779.1 hypothetical protein N7482_002656 [Penicillium canariense]